MWAHCDMKIQIPHFLLLTPLFAIDPFLLLTPECVAIENQAKAKTEPDCFLIRFLGLSGVNEPSAWEICARNSLFSFFLRSAKANMESHYNILDRSIL